MNKYINIVAFGKGGYIAFCETIIKKIIIEIIILNNIFHNVEIRD